MADIGLQDSFGGARFLAGYGVAIGSGGIISGIGIQALGWVQHTSRRAIKLLNKIRHDQAFYLVINGIIFL